MLKDAKFSTIGKTIAVVSHDAGGAEILSSFVRRQGLLPLFVLDGPAKKIFKRKLGNLVTSHLHDALLKADMLICSTSWQSDLEFEAIERGKSLGITSVAFIDHWINYRERFIRRDRFLLPDQIWVGDAFAESIAREVFAECPVFLEENPYFLDIKEELGGRGSIRANNEGLAVLYVWEPIREHAKLRYGNERHWGYVEEDALRYFLSNLSVLNTDIKEIRIRPHPSKPLGDYKWAINEFHLPIVEGGSQPLTTEITNSDVVVGCQSMAMVVGLLAGKTVISCIPEHGTDCMLPHPEILRLKNLIRLHQYKE